MKKLLYAAGVIVLLGAGCAAPESSVPPENKPAANEPAAWGNVNANVPAVAEEEVKGEEVSETEPSVAPAELVLEQLPEPGVSQDKIDDKSWKKFVTRNGITFIYPDQPTFSPSAWSQRIIQANDPHLRGNCYVTVDTKYQKTEGLNMEGACLTTTGFSAGPSTRTDYFVFNRGGQLNLFTMSKTYRAGFDVETYGATVEHIVRIID